MSIVELFIEGVSSNLEFHKLCSKFSIEVIRSMTSYTLHNIISKYSVREMKEAGVSDEYITYSPRDIFDLVGGCVSGILCGISESDNVNSYNIYGYTNCCIFIDHFVDSWPCEQCRLRFKEKIGKLIIYSKDFSDDEEWHCKEGLTRLKLARMWLNKFENISSIIRLIMVTEKVSSKSFEVMLKSSMIKGSLTYIGFMKIINIDIKESDIVAGMLCQLADDIGDILEDLEDCIESWVVILYNHLPLLLEKEMSHENKIDWLIILGFCVLNLFPTDCFHSKASYSSLLFLKLGGKGGELSHQIKKYLPFGIEELLSKLKKGCLEDLTEGPMRLKQ